MKAQFYLLVDPDSTDAFWDARDDVPAAYETEAEAVEAAKLYYTPVLVVKSTARVTEISRHKVEKVK